MADYKNNESWVTVQIKGTKTSITTPKTQIATPYYIKADQTINLTEGKVSVDFYKNTFYEDFYIDFEVKNDTLKLHEDTKAAKKNFTISFDVSNYTDEDKNNLYIARLVG